MGWIRRVVHSTVVVDRGGVVLTSAVRVGVLITLMLLAAVSADRVSESLAAAIGMLFAGIADPGRADGDRLRWMVVGTVCGTLTVLIAGAVSGTPLLLVGVGIPVALVCGFAGAFGPRAGIIGLLSLVLFAIFSGAPATLDLAERNAVTYLAGGLIVTALTVAPWALHRSRGSRAAIAEFHRGLAHIPGRDPAAIGAPIHAARERAIAETIRAEHPIADVRAWLEGMHADAGVARLALLAMVPGADAVDAELARATDDLVRAARALSGRIAAAIVWPVRRGRIPVACDALRAELTRYADRAPGIFVAAATDLVDALDRTATAVTSRWPVRAWNRAGARAPHHPLHTRVEGARRDVRDHLDLADPLARHAIRVAVVFAVAATISVALDLPHGYWLPMTVAWVSRPALGETTVKVAARVVGTVVGVVAAVGIASALQGHDVALAVGIGIGGAIALVFLAANYTLAVTGVTLLVLQLFVLGGDPVLEAFALRIAMTVGAGALVVAGAFVWPTRTGGRLAGSLADYSAALDAYAGPALAGDGSWGPDGRDAAVAAVLDARTRAAADLTEAEYELGGHRLDPQRGHAVLESLHGTAAQCLLRDLEGASADDHDAVGPVSVELTDLAARLRSADAGEGVPVRDHPSPLPHPVHRTIRHAHEILDPDARDQTGSTATRVSE
ncbi:MAG: FUSC family protein [Actinomycetes bacterium]